MGRITVQDAVSALLDMRLTTLRHVRSGTDDAITSVAEDRFAGSGAAAWLSAAAVAGGSDRVSAFRGSFLIVPEAAFESAAACAPARVTVVASARPKLAMIRLLQALVGPAPSDGWPNEDPVCSRPVDLSMGSNVRVAPGVVFGAGVSLGDDVIIGPNCCIAHATIGSRVAIGANCTIGMAGFGFDWDDDGALVRFPHLGDVIIEDDVEIGSNTCIDRGALGSTLLRTGCKIDNLVHIAHNVVVGERSLVIAHAMVGGGAVIGADAWVAPSTAIMNKAVIGEGSVVGLGAVVLTGTEPGQTVVGNPARPLAKAKGTDVTPG